MLVMRGLSVERLDGNEETVMRTSSRIALMIGVSVMATVCCAQDDSIKFRTGRPGNLFAFGSTVVTQVEAPGAGAVTWRAADYNEDEVGTGEVGLTDGKGSIKLSALPRGYYELVATAGGVSGKLAFGVVTDHSAAAPPSTRLNVDGATAWLEHEGRHDQLAQILRMVGIGWVRERFSWGGTEAEKGKVDWKQYDGVADLFTKHGVRVYQIFHDTPAWTHPGNKQTRNPEDLRDVYAFTKRLAEHYKSRVRAWEVWNEPDISFWPDLGDTFAGLQKAAYLGFKAGDAELPVLLGSFCRGYCAFDESLFEAGIAEYFDIFNWHIYAPPERYPGVLQRYLELLARYGCDDRPVWLTEAGIRLKATEPGGEVNADDERKQAEFVPKSFAWSLAAGTDRHFFFVYPYYLERGVQFGSLRKDLSPRPGFVAIAAAVDILGEAVYLGQYELDGGEGATALAFDTGKQRVLVIWSETPQTVELALGAGSVEVASVVGRRETRDTAGGKVKLEIGPSPKYVIGIGKPAMERISGELRTAGELPVTRAHPVVIRGQAQIEKLDKGKNAYLIGNESFSYTIEVCNLSEDEMADGRIWIGAPQGWQVDPGGFEVALEPMGRTVGTCTVTPAKAARGELKLWARGKFEEGDPKPSVSYFRFDPEQMEPREAEDLGLNDPAWWQKNISGNGSMEIEPGPDGGVRFAVKFTKPGDRWCYPRVEFDPPRDFTEFDGIAFEYRCHGDDDEMTVRLQAIEAGGSSYLTGSGWKAKKGWTRAVAAFDELGWGSFSAPDPNHKLDTGQIAGLLIGLNTPRDEVWLEVRNVRLVKLWQ